MSRTPPEGNNHQEQLWAVHGQAARMLLSSDVDFSTAVNSAFGLLGQTYGVDSIYVWRIGRDESGNLAGTHGFIWDRNQTEQTGNITGTLSCESEVLETINLLENGQTINAPVRELSDSLRQYYAHFGIVSFLAVPLFDDNQFWGFIAADERKTERRWSVAEEHCLQSFGMLLISAFRQRQVIDDFTESNQRFRDMVQITSTILWEFDLSFRFTYLSDHFFDVTGFDPREFVGKTIADWIHPDNLEEVKNFVKLILSSQSNVSCSYEFQAKHSDGTYSWFRATSGLKDGSGGESVRLHGAVTEIQEEKKEQEQIHQAIKSLEQTNSELALATINAQESAKKSEQASIAKSMFLATMSHEIRTPLNGVIGLSNLLLQTELSSKQLGYVQLIRSSGRSLLFLINDILDFSKIEAGKLELTLETFNLHELSESAIRILASQAEKKRLELCEIRSPDVPRIVRGDVNRLRQILINLIGNAVKFTETGGVQLILQTLPERENGIRFTVQDTGIGIPPEQIEKIFDAFLQLDGSSARKFGGTGLGLSISSKLVNLMGGSLTVESEIGKGSAFHISVSLEREPQEDSQKTRRRYSNIPQGNILVAAENKVLCESLKKQLAFWNLTSVKTVHSAEDAANELQQSVQDGNPFMLLILDNSLQKRGKDQLIYRLCQNNSAEHRKIPIILLQSLEETYSPVESGLFYSMLRLDKPVNASLLFDGISDALGTSYTKRKERYRNAETETPSGITGRFPQPFSILVAEDNKINQIVIKEILSNFGLTADIAVDGKAACEAAQQKEYAVILMDCQMPEVDGYEAARIIREQERHRHAKRVPIIALTANAAKGDEEKCLAAGMDAYCSKPINLGVLFDLLRYWTKQQSGGA